LLECICVFPARHWRPLIISFFIANSERSEQPIDKTALNFTVLILP
jgi:hypothetical protein